MYICMHIYIMLVYVIISVIIISSSRNIISNMISHIISNGIGTRACEERRSLSAILRLAIQRRNY